MGCVFRSFILVLTIALCMMRRGTSISIGEEQSNVIPHRDRDDDYQLQKLESVVADLLKEVEVLKSALSDVETAPREPRGHRTSRSTTTSGYFGSIQSGLYGNCTCRGDPGPVGPPGLAGRDGRDGRDAPMPCSFVTSPDSSAGAENIGQDAPTDQSADAESSAPARPGSGTYVRWGRTTCPDGSQLVYEAVVGGAHYQSTGSGTNYLCLPHEPIYDDDFTVPGIQNVASLYGAEYQVWADFTNEPWSSSRLHNRGPPCAVCLAQGRPSVLMVPARNVCPLPDWTLDYQGKLMTERHSHHRSEYICVDDNPEVIPGTASDVNEALLYPVEGRCLAGNSLPCGPYVEGHELTCAVCSQ